ncbi:sugar-phosphate isomerase, RpiB/LacA/LacB family [Anaeroglobus geminatus F0357]|uniref:Sugar-phosphate isomerase, RpiB/LacA/LacB family n=1 Tax=Anaeroglobus geminatus F0357 TaxID=861450 RepID=G9YI09_9FIRM|nr:sugar-phosphate isomerase, RpiB/LacA/LacB family [Anaeroglobus geminatus F0357]
MKLVIAADHGGFRLKEDIKQYLAEEGIEFTDYGTHTPERCDYPLIAEKAARAVAAGTFDRGILVCGTGIGIGIAANKIHGIRAALCQTRSRRNTAAVTMTRTFSPWVNALSDRVLPRRSSTCSSIRDLTEGIMKYVSI